VVDSLIAPGLLANILERPNTVLSASQAPSTLHPLSRVADGRPSQMFIYPAIATDDYVQADINQIPNGDLDDFTAGVPDDFTVVLSGTGGTAEETSSPLVFSGTALRMTNGASGNTEVYADIVVLSGEPFQIRGRGATDDAAEPATLEVRNLQTGNYLTSGGAWQASQADVISLANTATLALGSVSATVEPFSVTRSHTVTLRVRLHMDGIAANKQHNWDDVLYLPGVLFASVHGHNLDPKITPELHSDDELTFTAPTDHGDFAVEVPTFYRKLGALVYDRFWRFAWTGTQSTETGSTALGLLWLGNVTALLRTPTNTGLNVAEELPQEEAETRLSGEQWRTKYAKFRRRFVSLKFRHTQTMQTQFRDEILKRTNDGVDPILLVVRDDRPTLCVHGRRPAGRHDFVVEGGEVDNTELIVHESGWGVLTD
jgi:hypothetical protein